MAIFRNNPDESQRLDWRILQNGWTNLYWQKSVLEKDLEWFKNEQFKIVDFDCKQWMNATIIHKALAKQLDFPDYYGENFNALNDCLSDLQVSESGIVIVFRYFQFVDKEIAHALLDIFAMNSRLHILFGKKLLTLVQVDEPNYQIKPVGCCPVLWNGAEWENSKRGL
ncbi:MAG: barstar family protein [Flavisolibacter sp.]